MTLEERVKAIKAKPENERSEDEKLTLRAFEEHTQRALHRLKGE